MPFTIHYESGETQTIINTDDWDMGTLLRTVMIHKKPYFDAAEEDDFPHEERVMFYDRHFRRVEWGDDRQPMSESIPDDMVRVMIINMNLTGVAHQAPWELTASWPWPEQQVEEWREWRESLYRERFGDM